MRLVSKLGIGVIAILVGAGAALYVFASRQGRQSIDWTTYDTAKVSFDSQGIPTIRVSNWEKLIEAQGYVVASDRLWHMDLMRRSASGGLVEWFGTLPKAVERDVATSQQDWIGVADRAAASLPKEEKRICEAYARGVNRFIDESSGKWSIEYFVLRQTPRPWLCRDSLLIVLAMADQLSSVAESEAESAPWRENLPPAWRANLFPDAHPWNQVTFPSKKRGTKKKSISPAAVPEIPEAEFLPKRRISQDEVVAANFVREIELGSNSWAWRGPEGAFLANDPHLGLTVPQLWYAVRLHAGTKDWVVGVSIPGVPGVVIGRNAHFAWAFTNVKEDVDDFLIETLSDDGKSYLDGKTWKPVATKAYEIPVKGKEPIRGVARSTSRGPLIEWKGKLYSRQWLPLKPGQLRIPVVAINRARGWEDLNRALDDFASPAQAVLFMDNTGGIGLRISGRGVRRRVSGLAPLPADQGEWRGILPPSERRRFYRPVAAKGDTGDSSVVSNQRHWEDEFGHHWSNDLRSERIERFLSSSEHQTPDTMAKLQLDTESRFLRQLAGWMAERVPETAKWKKWDGRSDSDETVFGKVQKIEERLSALLLSRVRSRYLEPGESTYRWKNQNTWLIRALEPGGLVPYGLDDKDTAQWLFAQTDRAFIPPHAEHNRWRAQHPFALAIPVLGNWFALNEPYQPGHEGVVRVQKPTMGASFRVVFDMKDPQLGRWTFPVGQSGHVASAQYKNLREDWFAGRLTPILAETTGWELSN